SVHSCSCSDDTSPPHTSSLPLHDALPISEESKRAALVADELQVPILTLTRAGKITDFGPNVFRNMLTDAAQADALAQYATKVLGYKSFAVLYPNVPYGVDLANQFWDRVVENGGASPRAARCDHR